jgi:ABC-type polysaccharide/polyol phosphate transport system ATPase subunit
MNENFSVSVRNISKKYYLFSNGSDRLRQIFNYRLKKNRKEYVALNSISFNVKKGETFGILGINGSGKSTLLQIISGILRPTSGELFVEGRVSTLLELGAGFNPEYTGRENCIFQAQMMGMSKDEIDLKLPEIENFADIGEFYDQPVKVYSTGMFVRVAFAVATSVDPDILIIDEALSVGDASFQEKCFRRLRQFKSMGKTIIFVTHSLDSITDLCDRAMILHCHRIFSEGDPREIVDKYLKLILSPAPFDGLTNLPIQDKLDISESDSDKSSFLDIKNYADNCTGRIGYNKNESIISKGGANIIDFKLVGKDGITSVFESGEVVNLFIKVLYKKNIKFPMVGFEIKNLNGVKIFATNSFIAGENIKPVESNSIIIYNYTFNIPLNAGDYFIDLGIAEKNGSEGGYLIELRKSIIHLLINPSINHKFNGLVNLSPVLSEINN